MNEFCTTTDDYLRYYYSNAHTIAILKSEVRMHYLNIDQSNGSGSSRTNGIADLLHHLNLRRRIIHEHLKIHR